MFGRAGILVQQREEEGATLRFTLFLPLFSQSLPEVNVKADQITPNYIDDPPVVDIRYILATLPKGFDPVSVSEIAKCVLVAYPKALPAICDLPELLRKFAVTQQFPPMGDGPYKKAGLSAWSKTRWITALTHPYPPITRRFMRNHIKDKSLYSHDDILTKMGEVSLKGRQHIVYQALDHPHLILPKMSHTLLFDLIARMAAIRAYYIDNMKMPAKETLAHMKFSGHQWRGCLAYAAPTFIDRLTMLEDKSYDYCEEPRHTAHIRNSEITKPLDCPSFQGLDT